MTYEPSYCSAPRPDADARLALLQALYLQTGLSLAEARAAALADYACSFEEGEISP